MTGVYEPEPHTLPLLRACKAHPAMAPWFGVKVDYEVPTICRGGHAAAKRHAPELKARAMALLTDGVSILEVSQKTGISQATLTVWRRLVIPDEVRLARASHSREKKRHALDLFRAGRTMEQVARAVGVPVNTLKTWRRAYRAVI